MTTLNKLKLKTNKQTKEVEFNEETIKVLQYLPIQKKLEAASDIVNLVLSETRYNNYGKTSVYLVLAVIEYYTDIKLTEKQRENPTDLYDLVVSTGLYSAIVSAIPKEEFEDFSGLVYDSVAQMSDYFTSVYGILDSMSKDYDNLDLDIKKLTDEISNKDNVQFLDKVMDKMG